mgnify:CR=1 FL=1
MERTARRPDNRIVTAFNQRLLETVRARNSNVCVGLDPDPARLNGRDAGDYMAAIVEATAPYVAAVKPNLAFFEGPGGEAALRKVLAAVPDGVLVVGDAKRGDIGNTAEAYARTLFESWGFDAATGNAWGGGDAIAPMLARPEHGCFIWCRSSNPGGRDLQDLVVRDDTGQQRRVFEVLAALAAGWNTNGNTGLVVGATYPGELASVRSIAPDLPILIPGIGAQGGDLEASVRAASSGGKRDFLISSSRSIIYASPGDDFAQAAAQAARELQDEIQKAVA